MLFILKTSTQFDQDFKPKDCPAGCCCHTSDTALVAGLCSQVPVGAHRIAGMEFRTTLLLLLVIGAAVAQAADPEVTADFWPPEGDGPANGSYFTFTGFRDFNAAKGTFTIKKGAVDVFPALQGLGVSYSILEYYPDTTNPVHTHPRGTELLYLIKGQLDVGLVDTSNTLYTQTLQEGDVFVFPKGLLHYQINLAKHVARAISAFSSSNPGTLSLPAALFSSGIPSVELETAFKVDAAAIDALEAAFRRS